MQKSPRQRTFPALSRRQLLGGAAGLSAAAMLPVTAWAQGTQLNVRVYTEPDTADPLDASGFGEAMLYGCIYRNLIQYVPGDTWGHRNDLAESIEQTSDTTIAFTLKAGQMWSDGYGEITAEDVAFTFERNLDPEMNSRILPDIGPLNRVEVTGTHSGVFHFDEPYAPFWTIALPYLSGAIMCKAAVEEVGGRIKTNVPPTVSGPYRVREQRPGERWVLDRNPDYSGDMPAEFERCDIVYIGDEAAAEIALESGDLDFTEVAPGSVRRLQDNPPDNTDMSMHPSLFYVWVGMNMANPKFEDKRVRQAIQYAINVNTILEAAWYDVAEPSTGIIAPGLIGHRPESIIPPEGDTQRARELLDEAGIDRLQVTLNVLNDVTFTTAAQVMQATVAPAGIDLSIEVHESGSFWTLGVEDDGERWRDLELIMNRFSMLPDPSYATAWFTTEQIGDWNWERFSNEEFDRLHKEARTETDPERRDEMYRRAQDLMEQSGAYRFITHGVTPNLYYTRVEPATRPDGLPLVQYFSRA
ncbi:ABC transporter substrate-binding protein [Roseovarius sp. D22-M7]|uniref:ABC transporter substrate-binding protein n=1 Tax=Roseovarius sp. D22-M7 TaxID=3127116 RepID=UPI00301022CD